MNNNKIAMVETNQGLMLLEDYLDIKAIQYGFDSYADMRTCGCYIDTPPVVEISVKEQDELIPVFAGSSPETPLFSKRRYPFLSLTITN